MILVIIPVGLNIMGALVIRTGFWGVIVVYFMKEP